MFEQDGKSLKGNVVQLLRELGCTRDPKQVAKELQQLIHNVSKPAHFLLHRSGLGVAIGGPEPLGSAIAASVVLLQRATPYDFQV
eukprot:5047796-Pleurochrysis_carterae.AAC.2